MKKTKKPKIKVFYDYDYEWGEDEKEYNQHIRYELKNKVFKINTKELFELLTKNELHGLLMKKLSLKLMKSQEEILLVIKDYEVIKK